MNELHLFAGTGGEESSAASFFWKQFKRILGESSTPIFIPKCVGMGKSTTRERALSCAKKEVPRGKRLSKDQIKVYAAHSETRMFGYGQWEYPQGETPTQFQPILIG